MRFSRKTLFSVIKCAEKIYIYIISSWLLQIDDEDDKAAKLVKWSSQLMKESFKLEVPKFRAFTDYMILLS